MIIVNRFSGFVTLGNGIDNNGFSLQYVSLPFVWKSNLHYIMVSENILKINYHTLVYVNQINVFTSGFS